MAIDLTAAAAGLAAGRGHAAELIEESLHAARAATCDHAFLRWFDQDARAAAHAADAARAVGQPLPLGGLAVSVKDLFDVQGVPTTAGSKVLAHAAPAIRDCTVVARLRAAGAALIGHTNLTEFAYSRIGINPHFGTPHNPATAVLDPATPRIPGGSTSGGAVSVAAGAAWAALGSDTGGSIRIPAAFCGLVGYKNTQALTPLDGTIPLAPSLDTTCAITRSVRDAVLMHEVLAGRRVTLVNRRLSALRFALPQQLFLDNLDATVTRAFERSVAQLRAAGATVVETAIDGLQTLEIPQRLAGIVAAEAWSWHREKLSTQAASYDPRIAERIRGGAQLTAADVRALHVLRSDWRARVARSLDGFDAVIAPTVPIVAPPLAPLIADDELFTTVNLVQLGKPVLVNHLDGCAISLPCHLPDEMPVGLTLFSTALRDDTLLDAALQVEAALAERR
jgi:amidase/aspartyl-tRNA(Asn)/glutamyl-tRNA(Gln) amidotransferase subunit A